MEISLTERAAKHVRSQLQSYPSGLGLRLGVRKSGCSGWAYVVDFAESINAEDLVFENHGVRIVTDPSSMEYLNGLELDFVREGLNQHFKFNNPNVVDECGCGESFSVN